MTRNRLIGFGITLLILSASAFGDEISFDEIQKKVVDSYKALDTYKAEGTITSAKVSFPKLRKSDFKFALPEGTVLEDSLFGGMLKANKTASDRAKGAL